MCAKFNKRKSLARAEIRDHARQATDETLCILSDATESFILSKMGGLDLRALFKGKKRYTDELTKDYEENFLCLKNGWVENCGEKFVKDIAMIVNGHYIDFINDLESEESTQTFDVGLLSLSEFVGSLVESLQQDALEKLIPALITAVIAVISIFIPGGEFVDIISSLFAGKKAIDVTDNSRIVAKSQVVISSCKVRMRQQKYKILSEYSKMGNTVESKLSSGIDEELKKHISAADQQKKELYDVFMNIDNCKNSLEMLKQEVEALFTVKG
jgi:hypothetical protein